MNHEVLISLIKKIKRIANKRIHLMLFAVFCFGISESKAQYKVLLEFDSTNGAQPAFASLAMSGKFLYGMTEYGGLHGWGRVFRMDTNGSYYKDLLDFDSANGGNPISSPIILGKRLYGTTTAGGKYLGGCIFSIDTLGKDYKDLYDFPPTSGFLPPAALTYGFGKFYSITWTGGAYYKGIIFSIDTNGNAFHVLYNFDSASGCLPMASLVLINGTLFGVTAIGGTHKGGTIYSIDTGGYNYRILHSFTDSNTNAYGALILSGTSFYGMTQAGGLHDMGYVYKMDTNSTSFKDLYDFSTEFNPEGFLTLIHNKLYGLIQSSIAYPGYGALFSVDTDGNNYYEPVTFNNKAFPEGAEPLGSLILSGRNLYGMTTFGGRYNQGVVFKVDTGRNGAYVNGLNEKSGNYTISPNPSSGIFTLHFVGAQNFEPKNIEIYNALGERVETQCIASLQTTINLTNQPTGIYFYRVVSENGGLVGEGKVVIEK